MVNAETLRKYLPCHATYGDFDLCIECPYNPNPGKIWKYGCVHGQDKMIDDAIKLLKEQEAKWIYGEDETGADGWHCSYCGFFEPWFYEFTDDIDFIRFYSFCPSCGRKMTSYTGKPTQEGR